MNTYPKEVVVRDKKFKVLIEPEAIDRAIDRIAAAINKDYADKNLVFVVTLKGAMFFATDLLKKIRVECEIETIRAKSYGSQVVSSGKVVVSNLPESIRGKDIIILEDIVDTGLTVVQLKSELAHYEPQSLKVATLLLKPDMLQSDVSADYVGIEIPPEFVVGYGLDYAESGRNYPAIYSLDEK